MTDVQIIGAGMTKFGKLLTRQVDDLGTEAALTAIRDAGVPLKDVQAAWCGHVFAGPVAGQRIMARLGIAGIPVTNVENYCSSGSTALREAAIAVGAGLYDVVLVVGVEKLYGRVSGGILPDDEDLEGALGLVMAAQYAMRFKLHSEKFGTTRAQVAKVSVKNHRNSVHNANSQYRREVTLDEVLASTAIVEPAVNLLDCCPIGDGAAAVIVASAERARQYGGRPVTLRTVALNSGQYQTELADLTFESITAEAGKLAYEASGVGPEDIDVAEVHDCFSMAEVMRVEGLGLCKPGEYGPLIDRGHWNIGGVLPVNPSGGLLSKGHPMGATGVAQVAELVWQLRGDAGIRQVEGARVGLAHCRGGTVYGTDGGSCTVAIVSV
ncbi:MAG: thiolase family protein [Candidatus Dormibacteraeota bacterium]|uniref:propanoyl-CoA C-acyltransferase n=1 Tax=Candidatus Aeolococcus gillhamiae TaxID=3127015 RepID=A0A934N919_9BACT|nr:thiolase family protein [Candidatus Dormibacteraeota bacterium]